MSSTETTVGVDGVCQDAERLWSASKQLTRALPPGNALRQAIVFSNRLPIMEMPWKEIDWEAERPSLKDVSLSRKQLEFIQTDVTSPAALGLIETFRSLLKNGGAHIASFHVHHVDATARWFFSRNRFDEYGFIPELLASDAVANALPDLAPIAADLAGATFEESSPLIFDGELARALIWGGPYAEFNGSMADAKQAGVNVCSELIGERFEDFRLDYSHEPWSTWFKGIAWDGTWILTDLRDQRVTLVCITDTELMDALPSWSDA